MRKDEEKSDGVEQVREGGNDEKGMRKNEKWGRRKRRRRESKP